MLDEIIQARERIRNYAHKTPILTSRQLNDAIDAEIFIKAENLQRGGAFKFRGAFNTISQLSEEQKKIGVITHSSGNHAQAVAISGNILGIKTVIIMPSNAPSVKVAATKGYGAEVHFCEPTQEARERTVNELIEKFGYVLIHPYDNDNIIAGAGTASVELFEEIPDIEIIIAPIGGGGLISGTSIYTKLSGKNCKVYAAEPIGANDAYRSITENTHITTQTPTTIADGLKTTLSDRTLKYVQEYVDEILLVSDQNIIDAMRFLFERMKIVVEPSGAATVAALFKHKNKFQNQKVGVIISGGNLDLTQFFDNLKPLDTL